MQRPALLSKIRAGLSFVCIFVVVRMFRIYLGSDGGELSRGMPGARKVSAEKFPLKPLTECARRGARDLAVRAGDPRQNPLGMICTVRG